MIKASTSKALQTQASYNPNMDPRFIRGIKASLSQDRSPVPIIGPKSTSIPNPSALSKMISQVASGSPASSIGLGLMGWENHPRIKSPLRVWSSVALCFSRPSTKEISAEPWATLVVWYAWRGYSALRLLVFWYACLIVIMWFTNVSSSTTQWECLWINERLIRMGILWEQKIFSRFWRTSIRPWSSGLGSCGFRI